MSRLESGITEREGVDGRDNAELRSRVERGSGGVGLMLERGRPGRGRVEPEKGGGVEGREMERR
eukprot:3563196-Rhodomonas_salina.2